MEITAGPLAAEIALADAASRRKGAACPRRVHVCRFVAGRRGDEAGVGVGEGSKEVAEELAVGCGEDEAVGSSLTVVPERG